jgi:cytochrome c biogenesis protein CcmG, thiol:disulfide interchange protein DsbE
MNAKIRVYAIILISLFLISPLFAKKAPDFTFKNLDGKEISLSDYKGKVIMVNFWATWCGPCIHEMPDLEKLYQTYKKDGLQIIGLTVSSKAKQIPIKIKKTGVTYPILLNAESAVASYGGFGSIPHTFIINRAGEIVKVIEGGRSYKDFEAIIKKLL